MFDTETELTSHSRSQDICELGNADLVEWCDKEQEKKLRSRKRPLGQTEEDRWREMYRILFPFDDDLTIPSPCTFHRAWSGHAKLTFARH